jgi:hypothetical protein
MTITAMAANTICENDSRLPPRFLRLIGFLLQPHPTTPRSDCLGSLSHLARVRRRSLIDRLGGVPERRHGWKSLVPSNDVIIEDRRLLPNADLVDDRRLKRLDLGELEASCQRGESPRFQRACMTGSFHRFAGPPLDSLEFRVSLPWEASHGKAIEFGPLVTSMSYQHRVFTCRQGRDGDVLSGGRFMHGVRVGW